MLRMDLLGLVAVLALGACRDETTSGPAGRLAPSFHREGSRRDALQFSEWSAPVNLGPTVNTTFIEQGESISRDGRSLYFQSDRPGGFGGPDIWVAQRACTDAGDPACAWQTPANLGPTINSSNGEITARVTIDGDRLYFASDRPGGFGGLDLYVSRRRDKQDDFAWQPPVNLGSAVNTAAVEFQPDPFEDDETEATILHFTSDRPGGLGLNDIYASTLQADGSFGPAVPVGELNTPDQDQQPAIRWDGLELFFASNRPETFGLIDLWVTTRASTADPWSTPVNLGAVVNSTVQDARPALSFDGTQLYFQSPRPGGLGDFDLYLTTRIRLHRTVLVDPNGRGDGIAKTIQEGIDMVAPGGRLRVAPGTYNEQVTVSKNDVVIVADDEDDNEPGGVVVNAHGHEFGFLVRNVSGVTIQGFRVEHAHEADIGLNGATFTTIRENVTTGAGHDGIQLMASNDNVIADNVVADNLAANACGVNVGGGSQRNLVRDNRLVNNEWGIQITGAATLDNVISENRALGNRGNGIRNVIGASGTIIEENHVSGNGFAPSTLTGTTAAGIRIGSGVGIVVRENRLFGNLPVELLQDAAATATFAANECGTSSPSGLCEGGDDDNGKEEPE